MLRSHRLLCGLSAAVMLTLSLISNVFVGLATAAAAIGSRIRDFAAIAFDPRPAVERAGLPSLVETESTARSLDVGQVLNFRKRRINRPDVGRWSGDNPSISFAA